MSKDCPNCPAFGKHCPHKVNGDPYFYDCYLTVADLEKEKAELKARVEKQNADILFLKHLKLQVCIIEVFRGTARSAAAGTCTRAGAGTCTGTVCAGAVTSRGRTASSSGT